jgi:hypothetical protein
MSNDLNFSKSFLADNDLEFASEVLIAYLIPIGYSGESGSLSLQHTYHLPSDGQSGEIISADLTIFPIINLETVLGYSGESGELDLSAYHQFSIDGYAGESGEVDLDVFESFGLDLDSAQSRRVC